MSNYLETPSEGIPRIVNTPQALTECLASLVSGDGPIAFDAERAHGHRYFPKAYLFQLKRNGSGIHLIDPIAFEYSGKTDLSVLTTYFSNVEFIIHAASQDLPCMVDDQIMPEKIFDTELASRLLNYPLVGLSSILEHYFGIKLHKAHSADNWAKRPLPNSWLNYAALDVELLIELRDAIWQDLIKTKKAEWAQQEFNFLLETAKTRSLVATDPWRKLKNLNQIKSRLGLAVARSLWRTRDNLAQRLDRPPSHLLSDRAIVSLAASLTDDMALPTKKEVCEHAEFTSRSAFRFINNWLKAIQDIESIDPKLYPTRRRHLSTISDIGKPSNWKKTNPDAYKRWLAVKPAIEKLANEVEVPPANLISPATLRNVTFSPPQNITARLAELSARPWQIKLVTPVLTKILF